MNDITLAEVKEYYKVPPVSLGDGRWKCPLPSCEYVTTSPQAIGPHKAGHARRVGMLAPSVNGIHKHNGTRKLAEPHVSCPFPGCGQTVSRGHLKGHYRTIHGRSGTQAAKACDPVLAATRTGNGGRPGPSSSKELEPVKPPPQVNGHAIDIPDAVMAVLMGTTGKQVVKMTDLPEIIRLALHTQSVVDLVKG